MRVELVEVLWKFGKFPSAKLPQIANQELLKGIYGKATADIAAMYNPTYPEVRELFEKAIIEIKGRTLAPQEMIIVLITAIVQKEISPADGGAMLGILYDELDKPENIWIFKILSSEYKDFLVRYADIKKESKLRMLETFKRRCEEDIFTEAQNYFQNL